MTDKQIKDFILLVETMRLKQKEFFRGKMGRDLDAAKKLEREVDKFIADYKTEQLEALQGRLF